MEDQQKRNNPMGWGFGQESSQPQAQTGAAGFAQAGQMSKTFLANVFSYMFAGLLISGAMAYAFGTFESLKPMLWSETGPTGLAYFVMFAPLGFVLLMGLGWQKMSAMGMLLTFIAFSAIMGMSLSSIFIVYSLGSITTIFGYSALLFGVMALLGYTTKTDLTKLGSILMVGLIVCIVAMLINFFVGSWGLDFLITIVMLLIFTGLTAYDMQKLKEIGGSMGGGTAMANKVAIMGAVSLYLDFINIFLLLLRLFGSRD